MRDVTASTRRLPSRLRQLLESPLGRALVARLRTEERLHPEVRDDCRAVPYKLSRGVIAVDLLSRARDAVESVVIFRTSRPSTDAAATSRRPLPPASAAAAAPPPPYPRSAPLPTRARTPTRASASVAPPRPRQPTVFRQPTTRGAAAAAAAVAARLRGAAARGGRGGAWRARSCATSCRRGPDIRMT